MFLIVSGVNCAGKTSLCHKLIDYFEGLKTQHFSNPKDMEDGRNQYFSFLDNMDKNSDYLLDRFHEGEWIYAPIYRGYTAEYLLELENKMYGLDYIPFFIYVHAAPSDVRRRIARRGEDFMRPEHLGIEKENFEKFMHIQHLPYVRINTSKFNNQQTLERTLAAIDKYSVMQALTKDWEKVPRGNVNATTMYIVNDEDDSTRIVCPSLHYDNAWITIDRDVQKQIDIIKPEKVVVL